MYEEDMIITMAGCHSRRHESRAQNNMFKDNNGGSGK